MKLEILTNPHFVLRASVLPVEYIDDKLRLLISDMIETMYAAGGAGLAAPQISRRRSLFIIDWNGPQVFINPSVELVGKRFASAEECLSLPGMRYNVPRAPSVRVRAVDLNNFFFTLGVSGPHAIAIQHEMDHLRGKLICDYPQKKRQR